MQQDQSWLLFLRQVLQVKIVTLLVRAGQADCFLIAFTSICAIIRLIKHFSPEGAKTFNSKRVK